MKPLTEVERKWVKKTRVKLGHLDFRLESYSRRCKAEFEKPERSFEVCNAIIDEALEFRMECREYLLLVVWIAKNRDLELIACRRIAVALEDEKVDPLQFVFDAKVEIDSFLDVVEQPLDVLAHVDRLFADCTGSHADKGLEMASMLTDDEWEAYKEARGGKPITTTVEKHFAQRSKDAAKSPK